MKSTSSWRIGLVRILLGSAIVLTLVAVRGTKAGNEPIHVATDWSHHHLIFSTPKSLGQHVQLLSNPRYVQQLVRRNAGSQVNPDEWRWNRAPETSDTLHGDWSEDMGSGATVGAGNYPAKYSFNEGTANCANVAAPAEPDFVVYNTSLAGSASQATIVAFDNLYTGCTMGTVPSVYWSFNTGAAGAVVTSPALSGDGTQVAFIQSTAGAAELVLLKWKASSGTLATPVTPTSETNANYRGCTAPCMTTITFSGGATHTDTQSSPFYDFAPGSDTLYVGDSVGVLHKFTGVFSGTPAEAGSPWPVTVATVPLSSPVYDDGSGKVFVTTSRLTSNDSGSRLTAICATGTSCGTIGSTIPSGILGPATAATTCQSSAPTTGDAENMILDAPILDPTNETVYAAVGEDGLGRSGLYQFATGYALHTCGTEVTLGTGSTTTSVPVYAGNFDNAYYTGSAGHFYICGNAGGDPTLYQVTVAADGVLTAGAATAGPVLTTAAATCGPVVEFYNPNAGPATDWIFTNVEASGKTTTPISCPTNTGCIMSFNVTAGTAISATTATVGHTAVAGGASGVIVDNTVETNPTGGSQVYFTPLTNQLCTTSTGTGGCAIQASQSTLGE